MVFSIFKFNFNFNIFFSMNECKAFRQNACMKKEKKENWKKFISIQPYGYFEIKLKRSETWERERGKVPRDACNYICIYIYIYDCMNLFARFIEEEHLVSLKH